MITTDMPVGIGLNTMLSQLLQILKQNEDELDLLTVSRELHAHPTAVAGMLELLIQKGRVHQIGVDCGPCEKCGQKNRCSAEISGVIRYQLTERSPK